MANWFVRSLATGTGAGTSWTNATTTIAAAITLGAAGDTYFIADDHAETTTSTLVVTFKGSASAPDTVVCVDHTIASPGTADLKTTATVSVTGTAAGLQVRGYFYCYGITWNCGTSTSAQALQLSTAAAYTQHYEKCSFVLGGTGAQQLTVNSGTDNRLRWTNCLVSFGATSQTIVTGQGLFEWVNTPTGALVGSVPTLLFTGQTGRMVVEGVDLSALGSGTTLVSAAFLAGVFLFKECKIGSLVTVAASFNQPSEIILLIRCDSGTANYRNEEYHFEGTGTTETTIVRTGGATDGTTGFSNKIVTNTQARWPCPYEMSPIAIWNDTVGSPITVTVEGIASAVPNNDEVWMGVEYMSSATSLLGARVTTNKVVLATAAANTSSSSTWGGALTGKFKMAVTVTPQQKGPITVYVKVGKPSTTVYIDPFITVT
jgi:hypothetical protein